jgi:hypothetical protein
MKSRESLRNTLKTYPDSMENLKETDNFLEALNLPK